MDPLVYPLPHVADPITKWQPVTCERPPRPLLKYGYTTQSSIDYVTITTGEYYTASLDVYLDTESIQRIKEATGMDKVTTASVELWEIGSLSDLWKNVKRVLAPGARSVMTDIARANGHKWSISDEDGNADLAVYRYTNDPIEETTCLQAITEVLPGLFNGLAKGGKLVIQLARLSTTAMAELITFLASHFQESYLIRPAILSAIYDGCYFVGKDYRGSASKIQGIDGCLHSLGIEVPEEIDRTMACLAGRLVPARYRQYYRTKSYLDGGLYNTDRADMYKKQREGHLSRWIERLSEPGALDTLVQKAAVDCPSMPESILQTTTVY